MLSELRDVVMQVSILVVMPLCVASGSVLGPS